MTAAKTSLPRRRWLAFLDCAEAAEEPGGAKVPRALDEDINDEVNFIVQKVAPLLGPTLTY